MRELGGQIEGDEPVKPFNFINTNATQRIFGMAERVRCVCGGTSASKTISILVWCIDYASAQPNQLVSVVSESFPHLRKGAMLDFQNIMKDRGYWEDDNWNKSESTYSFDNGSKIEFFSADTSGKVHGPRRDVLFVNEANNVDYDIFDQLDIRTRKVVWCDWNPSSEFWYYTRFKDHFPHSFLTLTYLDNGALDDETVSKIEAHKHNKNWWKVYGLGQLGDIEGRIFTGWRGITDIPHEARLERRGLDFGYSHDKAAIVDIYSYNGGFIFDERLYALGQSNKRLATILMNMENPETIVVCDSAEPKSIDELRDHSVPAIAAVKGPGSVNRSINYMQDQRISYTTRSINLADEYRRYYWKTDEHDKILTIPENSEDHLLDAARYGLESLKPAEPEDLYQKPLPPAPANTLIY